MAIQAIDSPIEQRNTGKGGPAAILHWDGPLNNRQKALLNKLPYFNSRVMVHKRGVKITDALTAVTGDEFTMFTRGSQRLIIRGIPVRFPLIPKRRRNLLRRDSGGAHIRIRGSTGFV